MIDLHIHSIYSDGTFRPLELVEIAVKKGLKALSITDHDTISGTITISKFATKEIEVISGVEIGIKNDIERNLIDVEILGYLFDTNNDRLKNTLIKKREDKFKRIWKLIKLIQRSGFHFPKEEVAKEAKGDTIRRPHIWKVLQKYNPDKIERQEFFMRSGYDGDWFIPHQYDVSLEDAVKLIEDAGGIPIIAHPGQYNSKFAEDRTFIDPKTKEIIETCLEAGVKGIEVFYPYNKNSPYFSGKSLINKDELNSLIKYYEHIADSHEVLKTGGSDFHGTNKPQIQLGEMAVPYRYLHELKQYNAQK